MPCEKEEQKKMIRKTPWNISDGMLRFGKPEKQKKKNRRKV